MNKIYDFSRNWGFDLFCCEFDFEAIFTQNISHLNLSCQKNLKFINFLLYCCFPIVLLLLPITCVEMWPSCLWSKSLNASLYVSASSGFNPKVSFLSLVNPIQVGLWKLVEWSGGRNHLHTSELKNGHSTAQNGFKKYISYKYGPLLSF